MRYPYLPRVAELPVLLGRPESLPDSVAALACDAGLAGSILDRLSVPVARESLPAYAEALAASRSALAVAVGRRVTDDRAESQPNASNDEAFGIVRMDGAPLPILLATAAQALAGVVDLAVRRGCSVPATEWPKLIGGVEALIAWLATPEVTPRTLAPPPMPPARRPAEPEDALRRWVRGHHLFMVLAEGGCLALSGVTDAARRHDLETAVPAAVTATALMSASQAALHFAGDVGPAEYNAEIRPTLMPPIAPPKLTGLHWRDHEELVRRLRSAAPAWDWLSDSRPELVDAFRASLDAAYRAHRGVCEHFVGDRSPSLLATSRSSRPAGEVIDQFRRLRLDMLPPPRTNHEGGE